MHWFVVVLGNRCAADHLVDRPAISRVTNAKHRRPMARMTKFLPTVLGLATFSIAHAAFANEADVAACAASAEGDACVRSNGAPGVCIPDVGDPTVLTCDDAAAGEADDPECAGLAEGDACVRADGTGGTCTVDPVDGALDCEDAPGEGEADDPECAGLAEGDACVRPDGTAGTCTVDPIDGALDCEDGPGDGEADDPECAGLAEGDACVRPDGTDGTCVVDPTDGALDCEDGPGDGGADDGNGAGGDDGGIDDNKAACVELAEGDMCTRDDGQAGTCVPDDSDPGVLECEDDHGSNDDSSSDDDMAASCSVGTSHTPAVLGLLLLVGFVRRRRAA